MRQLRSRRYFANSLPQTTQINNTKITSIMTQNTQKTLTALNINTGSNLAEFLESGHEDLQDWLHEQADGHADVIYYAKAEALYIEASLNERQDAEAMVEVCGGFPEGCDMATRFCLLAFWITYARLEKETREEIETAIANLDFEREYYEAKERINEAIDCLEAL